MYWLENILKQLDKMFNVITEKYVYWTLVLVSLILGYFTLEQNKVIPQPETISELIKFAFHDNDNFLKSFFANFFTGIVFTLIGLGAFYKIPYLHRTRVLAIPILAALFGTISLFCAAYFIRYFLLLLFAAAIISSLAYMFFTSDSSRSSRYR